MSEDMVFAPRAQILTLEELYAVADAFISLGVKRIRVTGGEPVVRKGLTDLLAQLRARSEREDLDRKSVVEGKSESVRVDLGGGRRISEKNVAVRLNTTDQKTINNRITYKIGEIPI